MVKISLQILVEFLIPPPKLGLHFHPTAAPVMTTLTRLGNLLITEFLVGKNYFRYSFQK